MFIDKLRIKSLEGKVSGPSMSDTTIAAVIGLIGALIAVVFGFVQWNQQHKLSKRKEYRKDRIAVYKKLWELLPDIYGTYNGLLLIPRIENSRPGQVYLDFAVARTERDLPDKYELEASREKIGNFFKKNALYIDSDTVELTYDYVENLIEATKEVRKAIEAFGITRKTWVSRPSPFELNSPPRSYATDPFEREPPYPHATSRQGNSLDSSSIESIRSRLPPALEEDKDLDTKQSNSQLTISRLPKPPSGDKKPSVNQLENQSVLSRLPKANSSVKEPLLRSSNTALEEPDSIIVMSRIKRPKMLSIQVAKFAYFTLGLETEFLLTFRLRFFEFLLPGARRDIELSRVELKILSSRIKIFRNIKLVLRGEKS
jgi:hypothetical protein